MKLPPLLTYLSISLLAMGSSCEKAAQEASPAPCSEAEIVPVPVANWTLHPSCFKEPLADGLQSQQYVIRSAAAYSAAVACSPPGLDYGQVSLLLGKTRMRYTSRVVSQRVTRTCTGVKYTITVENGLGAATSEAVYSAVVPRLASDATVEFDVQVR